MYSGAMIDRHVENDAVIGQEQQLFIQATEQNLSPELQNIVQVLCDTYETIDLRIETTLGRAEADFIAALPEVVGHETELRLLAKLLMSDLRASRSVASANQPVLLRFTYQGEGDLVQQLLSGSQAHVVVMPADSPTSLHADINGFNK